MSKAEFLRVKDADDVDDAVVVRIWRVDGSLVGEADHPSLEEASTNRIISAALGNPVPVPQALAIAQRMRQELPMFKTICVQIEDLSDWSQEWGELLPIKPSSLISKPLR